MIRKDRTILWPDMDSPLKEPLVKTRREMLRELTVGTIVVAVGTAALAAVHETDERPSESVRHHDRKWSIPLVD